MPIDAGLRTVPIDALLLLASILRNSSGKKYTNGGFETKEPGPSLGWLEDDDATVEDLAM